MGEAVSGKIFLYQGSWWSILHWYFELGSNVHPSFYAPEGSDFKIQIVLQGAGNSVAIQWTWNYNDNNTCEKEAEEINVVKQFIGNTWAPNDTLPMAATQQDKHFIILHRRWHYLRLEFKIGKAVFNLMG